jgi:hypothetical protein
MIPLVKSAISADTLIASVVIVAILTPQNKEKTMKKNDKYLTPEELWDQIKKNPIPYICIALLFAGFIALLFLTANSQLPPSDDSGIWHFGKSFGYW